MLGIDGRPDNEPARTGSGVGAGVGLGDGLGVGDGLSVVGGVSSGEPLSSGVGLSAGAGLSVGVTEGPAGAAAAVLGSVTLLSLLSAAPPDLQPDRPARAIAKAKNTGFDCRSAKMLFIFFMIRGIRHDHLIGTVDLWLTDIKHKM